MTKQILTTCLTAALMTVALSAAQKGSAPAAQSKTQPAPAPAPAAPPVEVRRRNVSIELAINDQTGSAEAVKKVVTLIVADRQTGSVRSSGNAVVPQNEPMSLPPERETLNVDAMPLVHQDDSVLLSLTIEYMPRRTPGESGGRAQLNERISVTLDSGKPMVISRSADPGSSRKISVEVTATVMK
jgi:hypothetical protein